LVKNEIFPNLDCAHNQANAKEEQQDSGRRADLGQEWIVHVHLLTAAGR